MDGIPAGKEGEDMGKDIDLSVEIKGVKFKNPIVPASSDIVMDEKGLQRCIEQGVGGIVTKSFTWTPFKTRARPYHFNYRVFGKGLENNWISKGSVHHMDTAKACKTLVPKMAAMCRDAGIPLVVSIMGGESLDEWGIESRRFEEAGADMLELNMSCPHAGFQIGKVAGRTVGENLDLAKAIIGTVKDSVKIPVSAKLSPILEPLSQHVTGWLEAGADCFSAHNAPYGIMIDIDKEVPFGGLGPGGYLMGRSFLPLSLARIVETKRFVDLPIMGIGGVTQAQDAIMYILLGCPVVQVGSAVFKHGYRLFEELVQGIEQWMEKKQYTSIQDFIGNAVRLASLHSSQDLIEMERPFVSPKEKTSPVVPSVNLEKCVFCGRCQDSCLSDVFKVDKKKKSLELQIEGRCWGCGDCAGWCPANAITMIDKERAEVVWENKGLAKPYRPEMWKHSDKEGN
jgi:dihydroorotate dehydrogenase subfamily 1